MPVYRIILDGTDTGKLVSANSYVDAYFDAASEMPLTYKGDIILEEVNTQEP